MPNRGLNDEREDLWQDECLMGRGFLASTPLLIIATLNEVPFFLFRNPPNSGRIAVIRHIVSTTEEIESNKATVIRLYRDPTITSNGTLITPESMNGGTPNALAYHTPTLTSFGTLVGVRSVTNNNAALLNFDLGYYLTEGHSLALTADLTKSGFGVSAEITWVER